MLKVRWWPKQVEVANALLTHKRVFVKASHSVGKSFLAGGLVNWFFDCYDPGICITSAPTATQVRDILWKEVRIQRPAELRDVLQPKAPRMETSPDHFAVGFTTRDDSAFQGRHEEHVLIVFDECVGMAAPFWDAAEGMMTGAHCYFLAVCNPTDTSSRAFAECQDREKWRVIEISAMDHPNIQADLSRKRPPYPKAVRLGWVEGRIREWSTPVHGDRKLGDFEFRPGSGNYYRPGPLFESRVLGRWPTQGSTAVWSEAAWAAAIAKGNLDPNEPLEMGCDVARFGDDFTSIVVRRGGCVLHHETHNGWTTVQTAGRLKQLAEQFVTSGEDPHSVRIQIDDDGVGAGVTDQRGEFRFTAIRGGICAIEPDSYPNRRSELWFALAARASEGRLDLSRLSGDSLALIQRQLMAPTWSLDSQGRRVVEQKSETKRRLGRSPDDADALNLAFASPPTLRVDTVLYHEFWAEVEARSKS